MQTKTANLSSRLVADAARIVRYVADAHPLSTTDQVLIVHALRAYTGQAKRDKRLFSDVLKIANKLETKP